MRYDGADDPISLALEMATMPVRKLTAKELLGNKPLVLSAQPFHKGLEDDLGKRKK